MLNTPARTPVERTCRSPASSAASAEFESSDTVRASMPSSAKKPSSFAIISGA
jgi:hypothetical protein